MNISNFNNPNDFFEIFVYLTDVGPGNGCMSYIPESHKIGYAIKKEYLIESIINLTGG